MPRIISLLFSLSFLCGCALFEKDTGVIKIHGLTDPPYQRLYDASYEQVWRAVQISLSHYPIAINNMDSGILETDFIRMDRGWLAPEQPPVPPGGQRYKINVQVARGASSEFGKEVIRVRVTKNVVTQRDFFSSLTELPSDGLEEHIILYRIQREVEIDKALEKVFQRMQN